MNINNRPVFHDIIEDTDITAEHLLVEDFPQSVVDGILSVTKREGESYEDFVARAKQNPIGRVVKLYDLEDNLNACRLDNLSNPSFPGEQLNPVAFQAHMRHQSYARQARYTRQGQQDDNQRV